jgi:hypothetical protein
MCDLDPMDDGSSLRDTDCCDIGEWKPVGENLDGQLGRVKEVRDVYNCPSNVNNTQYERKICYLSGYSSGVCNLDGKNGQEKQTRTVMNCGTPSPDRFQYVTNTDCDMIHGVRSMVVVGAGSRGGGGMTVTLKSGDQKEIWAWSGQTHKYTFQSDVSVKAISGSVMAGSTDAWATMYLYDSADKELFKMKSPGVDKKKPKATVNIQKPAYETPVWVIQYSSPWR